MELILCYNYVTTHKIWKKEVFPEMRRQLIVVLVFKKKRQIEL